MLSYLLFGLLLAPVIILTGAGKTSTCRTPSIFQNFDITRVSGRWYKYSSHLHDFEAGCDCFTSDFEVVDTNTVQISSCCQKAHVSNETQECVIGITKATLTNPAAKEASFQYTRVGALESHNWIIDTDYDNYMVANGCDRISDDEERDVLWILSRHRQLPVAVINKIDDVLSAHNFEKKRIIRHKHDIDLCTAKRPTLLHLLRSKKGN